MKKQTVIRKKISDSPLDSVAFLSYHTPTSRREVPLMLSSVQAGLPSSVDDSVADVLDINDLFEIEPSSTFFVRTEGLSMRDVGMLPGDILCVRRDIEPKDGSTVIALLNGENTVKTLEKIPGKPIRFIAQNQDYDPIEVKEGDEVQIWGVVTGLARTLWH